NPVHSLFVLVHGFCTRARKKFFRIIYGVIHRTTPKTVDNPVDNLWTSAICLWVTQGPPVDKLLGHGSPNLGLLWTSQGKSVDEAVDGVWTTCGPLRSSTTNPSCPQPCPQGLWIKKQVLTCVNNGYPHCPQALLLLRTFPNPRVASQPLRGKPVDKASRSR